MKTKLAALLALAILGCGATAEPAVAKGIGSAISPQGIYREGSPFRYLTLSPGFPDKLTVVARINRRGGKVGRWWYLPGGYYVPASALDGTATGLAADGRTLILTKHEAVPYTAPPRTTLAIMETDRPRRPTPGHPRHPFVHFAHLKGEWALLAVSPDGRYAYLSRYRIGVERIGPHLFRPLHPGDNLEVRALDTASGELLPGRVRDRDGNQALLDGIPYAQVGDRAGRWTYTLFLGDKRQPYVYALDAIHGSGTRIALPHLAGLREPYSLHLRLAEDERELKLSRRRVRDGHSRERTVATIETASLAVHRPQPRATASVRPVLARELGKRLVSLILPGAQDKPAPRYGLWDKVIGRSAGGREIHLIETGNLALPGRLLVFGCIHGTECAGRVLRPLGSGGCPDPHSKIFIVPNLDPDGTATETRLNGRGVDLNRNFASGWRPRGERGDAEYPGPEPLSEPESRLAARIVAELKPKVTVWFHEHRGAGAYVRAWGQSAPAGREFAARAGIRFRLLPWLAGTAPNWQNHRFPGTASFVVELPAGGLREGLKRRLEHALLRTGREVGED
ncbi:MAG: M14 family zinc carboxypeptidase [Solirubrobacterales bacterium]